MTARHLVVFAREPRLGRVKSRLARGIGAVAALRFYRETLAGLLRRVGRDRRWRVRLAVTPDRAVRSRVWPRGARLIPQGGGDLGARMARPLRALPPGPVLIVGSDIPEVGARHIAAAFRALGRADVVFGPATDGGYWLVGAARRSAVPFGLFRDVRWSDPHALADTLAGLPRRARVAFIDILDDIDDAEDWHRWRARRRQPDQAMTVAVPRLTARSDRAAPMFRS